MSVSMMSDVFGGIGQIVTNSIEGFTSINLDRRVVIAGFATFTTGTLAMVAILLGVAICRGLFGVGLDNERRKKRQETLTKFEKNFNFIALAVSAATAIIGVLLAVGETAFNSVVSLAPWFIPVFIILATSFPGFIFVVYSDFIASNVWSIYVNFAVPTFGVIFTILSFVAMSIQSVYPLLSAFWRLLQILPIRVIQVVVICLLDVLVPLLSLLATAGWNFFAAILAWFQLNALESELPLNATIVPLGEALTVLSVQGIECSCSALRYVLGGAFRALASPSFAGIVTNGVNMVWMFISQGILQPLVSILIGPFQWPRFTRSFRLFQNTINSLGVWTQNATTYQFDIYITGGNGTIVGMVNGTIPMPTTALQFLIRFLQSEWAQALFNIITFILFYEDFWQILLIVENAQIIGTADGAQAWTFKYSFEQLIIISQQLGTVVSTLGTCDVTPTFPLTPYGNISAIAMAIFLAMQMVIELIIGIIYTLVFTQTTGGVYFQQYILSSPTKRDYDAAVIASAEALGCIIGFLQVSLGVSISGLIRAIGLYVLFIPLEFIAYSAAIIAGEINVDVLLSIEIQPFEETLVDVAAIGGIIFQFQEGANFVTCPTMPTFVCGLGLTLSYGLELFFRLLIVILEVIRTVIITIFSVFGFNTTISSAVLPPDILCRRPFNPTLPNGVGAPCDTRLGDLIQQLLCAIGVTVASIAPPIPCVTNTPNFCAITQFPSLPTNNFSQCFATAGCAAGLIISGAVELFLAVLNSLTDPNFAVSDFVLSYVKMLMHYVVYRLTSFICPLGHAIDCALSALNPFGSQITNAPVSSFFCYITAFEVVFLREVGPAVVGIVKVILTIIGLLFGLGDSDVVSGLFNALVELLSLLGSTLGKIVLAVVVSALSGIFNVFLIMCRLLNIISFNALSKQCEELSDAINVILGPYNSNINVPGNRNYKKDLDDEQTLGEATLLSRATCPFLESETFANRFFAQQRYSYPSLFTKQALHTEKIFPAESVCHYDKVRETLLRMNRNASVPSPPPSPYGAYKTSDPDATHKLSLMERILYQHFGSPVENREELPTHLATRIFWHPSSSCSQFFRLINGSRMSDLTAADTIVLTECLRLKILAVFMANTYSSLAWLPEDFLYNFMYSSLSLSMKFGSIVLNILQWINDRTIDGKTLLDPKYQVRWQAAGRDISFYTTQLLPLLDIHGRNASGYKAVENAVKDMTVIDYLERNMPWLYSQNEQTLYSDSDPVLDPIRSFVDFATELARDAVDMKQFEEAVKPINRTYRMYFMQNMTGDGDVSVIYNSQTFDYYNRTELLRIVGPDVMRAMDSKYSSIAMLEWVSRTTAWGINWFSSWVHGNASANSTMIAWSKRRAEWDATETPYSEEDRRRMVLDYETGLLMTLPIIWRNATDAYRYATTNSTSLWKRVREAYSENLALVYESPAFRSSVTRAGRLVANTLHFVNTHVIGAEPPKTLTPWCVERASTILRMSFDEVRDTIDPGDCQFYENEDLSLYQRSLLSTNAGKSPVTLYTPVSALQRNILAYESQTSVTLYRHLHDMFGAQNAQAEFNRYAVYNIVAYSAHEIWSYIYLLIGDDMPAIDRMVRVSMGVHPSFWEYSKSHSAYDETLKLLPAERQEELRQRKYIRYDDDDVFAAFRSLYPVQPFESFRKRIGEALRLKEAMYAEQDIYNSRPIVREHRLNARAIQNRLLNLNHGKLARDVMLAQQSMTPALNLSDFFGRQCSSFEPWLCDNCNIVDALIGKSIQVTNGVFDYYGNDFGPMLQQSIFTMNNTIHWANTSNPVPPLLGNNLDSPPRFPALGVPMGVQLQWSTNEISLGIDPWIWFFQIIGYRFNETATTGTCIDTVANYSVAADANTPTVNYYWAFIRFIQVDMGWNICGVIDTFFYPLSNSLSNIASWVLTRIFICDFGSNINCKARNYSFSVGLLLLLAYYIVLSILSTLIAFASAPLGIVIFGMGVFISPFLFLIVVYNWCVLCLFVIPNCLVQDIMNLLVYTATGTCNMFIGSYSSDPTYDDFCSDPSKNFTWANCQALGFANPMNLLNMTERIFGTDYNLGPIITKIFGSLPTFDYSDFETDPIRHTNYYGCYFPSIISYAIVTIVVGSVLLVLGVITTIALLRALIPFLIGVWAFLSFIMALANGDDV